MRKFLRIAFKISLAFLLLILAAGAVLAVDAMSVRLNDKKLSGKFTELEFFDSAGNEIVEADIIYGKKSFESLPKYAYDAFIAVEDKRFYSHHGVDLWRMAGAAWKNLKSFSFREGASTISQQLVKNTQLSSEKTIFRKTREIKLALEMERKYTKDQILDMYLNNIYFGSGCYGIESAARYYFDKSASQLDMNESAALAAMIKAPGAYSPFTGYEKLMQRKDMVLKLMHELGYITDAEYNENAGKDIEVCDAKNSSNGYNEYVKICLSELSQVLGIPQKELLGLDYKVYTYLDKEQQKILNGIVYNKGYYKDYYESDSAALVIDNERFAITAAAVKSKIALNRIIRQPGSAIKPILVYAPAIEYNLIAPATEILDEPTDFEGYTPSNYGGQYHGYVDVRTSLAKSLNVPAVKVFNSVGIDKAKLFARRCGIKFSSGDDNLGLALGGFTQGISLDELAASYVPLARGGLYKRPGLICRIADSKGRLIYSDDERPVQAMREDTAYLVSDMLKDSIKTGTASKLAFLPYPLHSKTGTVGNSSYNTDAYNITYSSKHTFAVWMGGLSGNKLDLAVTGGSYPTIMTRDIIKSCYGNNSPPEIERPESVVECELDAENIRQNHTLKLATELTPEKYVKKELFSVHFMPREFSDCFTEPEVPCAEIKYESGKVSIAFDAKSYLEYEVIRQCGSSEEVICKISDKEGEVSLIDENIKSGSVYQYAIVPHFVNKKLNKTVKGKSFMSKKILIPYNFSPDDAYDDYDEYDDYDDEKWWENDIDDYFNID